MTRASLDKDPRDVAAMFDDVAGKYDLTNDVLSLGQDRLWRRAVLKAVDAQRGETVLDIAAGTGTSSEPFADHGVNVVPADFSLGMLRVGKRDCLFILSFLKRSGKAALLEGMIRERFTLLEKIDEEKDWVYFCRG